MLIEWGERGVLRGVALGECTREGGGVYGVWGTEDTLLGGNPPCGMLQRMKQSVDCGS
jgi:hypothetical protein